MDLFTLILFLVVLFLQFIVNLVLPEEKAQKFNFLGKFLDYLCQVKFGKKVEDEKLDNHSSGCNCK